MPRGSYGLAARIGGPGKEKVYNVVFKKIGDGENDYAFG
jgi:hypothetical protein